MTNQSADVIVDRVGSVMTLTLNRQRRRNALAAASASLITQAIEEASEDEDVRTVVLSGAGTGFCSGSDLKALQGLQPSEQQADQARTAAMVRTISDCPVPVIAAVHGFAIGGGLFLAAACDYVVTSPDCVWTLPEARLGWLPPWGLVGLRRRVRNGDLLEMLVGDTTTTGTAAVTLGLADFSHAFPVEHAMAMASRWTQRPRVVLEAAKAAVTLHFEIPQSVDEWSLEIFMEHVARLDTNLRERTLKR